MRTCSETNRIVGRVGESQRTRLLFTLLAVAASFVAGVYYGRGVPDTLYTRPVATLSLMSEFPIGSTVFPLQTPEVKEHFERLGWGREPAVVVGYETVTIRDKEEMLCQIRTLRGAGSTLPVNPRWIAPIETASHDR